MKSTLIRYTTFSLLTCLLAFSGKAQTRPNIIIILADDLGYSDIGSYGGEINTPNLDALAAKGIKYRQFYNAARCCPTRASLMTGLYPHQAGMGWMAAADLGTPPYQGTLNNQCVTIAEVLKDAGYGTYMSGKWHLTNERKIDGMVTDSWPKQRGFDKYFGIIPGGANYFTPVLYSDNATYPAPDGFYLTDAISDTTVKYIDQHFSSVKNTPMFMYVAYTSPHWPLHALQKDIDKYKGRYDAGWDALREARFQRQKKLGVVTTGTLLPPRDEQVEPWISLSKEKQDEMAMRMAIYAAQVDIMDQGIGRIVRKLEEEKQIDNTLIFFLSDNGACAEFISSGESKEVTGMQDTFESYRIHWANMGSTPFREYKHYTHEGGIATPLIAHWPSGIAKNLNNTFIGDYGHVSDIMATCVDLANTIYPAERAGYAITPLEGRSLVPHFSGKANNRGFIYWEHEANIALRDGKWKLVAKTPTGKEFSRASLELFDMEADPSEMNNLALKYPERVKTMYEKWVAWAERIGAFPLDSRPYGVRKDVYNTSINGTFDDKLGGWQIVKDESVSARIEIDTTGQLSGKNALKISVNKPVKEPGAFALSWNLKASKGDQYTVALKTKASHATSFALQFQKSDKRAARVFAEQLMASQETAVSSLRRFEIPENGMYKLVLDFGDLKPGYQLWIDDVELVRIRK